MMSSWMRFLWLFVLFCCAPCARCVSALPVDTTDAVTRIRGYLRNVSAFNALFPQEKVYLHLDNTGYFAGETIWFMAYVVRADRTVATDIAVRTMPTREPVMPISWQYTGIRGMEA